MRIIYRLELIKSIIWSMMRFDDLFMTCHLVETHDRGTVSYVNYTLRFIIFYSAGLTLHTVRCHWWIVRSTSIISMIDNLWWTELEWFQPFERSFNDIMIGITIYLTTRQKKTYEITVGNSVPKPIVCLLTVVLILVLVYEL